MQSTGTNIVSEWLRSLHLGRYADSFIDNGYDDLEICKQVGDPDLDAIGVFNPVHRARLLHSVRTLREEGAASVYFSLEESVAVHEECLLAGTDSSSSTTTNSSSARSSRSGLAIAGAAGLGGSASGVSDVKSDGGVLMLSGDDVAKYLDEYEEGKAELVKIPRVQLKMLLREKLNQDGIRLGSQPYSTPDGERGYLEGLASRYADLFTTHYGDVLADLEDLRRSDQQHTNLQSQSSSSSMTQSQSQSGGGRGTPTTPPGTYSPPGTPVGGSSVEREDSRRVGMCGNQTSQTIYVPGKYLPSSCLSDKEEDEIYGFGYGVYGAQIARQQQQRLLGVQQASSHQPLLLQHQQNYQTCLSPRSAYFYEFPPNEQNYTNTGKKKTTFSRFLRGLKTSHRKEKHGASSPKHGRASGRGLPQRVDTPDSVLHSGLGMNDLGHHAVLRSMVDPRDYDRLRNLQLNGGEPNTFEETIYKLKLQEAMRKREKFTKEHEDILRDIKQGLLHLGKEGFRGPLSEDDTYMYDEDARTMLAIAPSLTAANTPHHHHHHRHHQTNNQTNSQQQSSHPTRAPHHWYDEPPYESDPEDFLMGSSPGAPTATIVQNGRVCYTSSGGGMSGTMVGGVGYRGREDGGRHRLSGGINPMEEGIISLRSAGDISLPREGICSQGKPRRGLILPQAGYPPTIIPLTHPRDRGESSIGGAPSCDYACPSDIHSLTSRLSTLSMNTNQQFPDSPDSSHQLPSPSNYQQHQLYQYNTQQYSEQQHIQHMQQQLQHQLAAQHGHIGGGGFRMGLGGGRGRGKVVGMYSRSEDGMSRSASSEYGEEEDDAFGGAGGADLITTVHVSSDSKNSTSSTVSSLVGKVRGLREDVQRKISRMKNEHGSGNEQSKCTAASASEQGIPYSASSVESLPSGSGSSTQALVRAGSNHSSISAEDVEPSLTEPRVIGRAKALVDSSSSPYDKDALKFKKGDIIEILSMNASGQWKGICNGRKGSFKFINVELISERNNGTSKSSHKSKHQHPHVHSHSQMQAPWQHSYALACRPKTVEDLLQQLGMREHISVLVLNGYEDLEQFKELETSDLDYLGIMDPEEREKILTAVQLMHDIDSCSEEDLPYSSSEGETTGRPTKPDQHHHNKHPHSRNRSPFGRRRQFPRDSGCYDAPIPITKPTASAQQQETSPETSGLASTFCDTTNNLDSVVEQCNNEILARVRQAQKNALNLKEDPYQPNIVGACAVVVAQEKKLAKDSYVSVHGHTTLIDPCRRNLLNRTAKSKLQASEAEVCEADQKLNSVKYIVGASSANSESPDVISHVTAGGNKGCLSEKSSDSGVSSSSLSSKDSRNVVGIPQNITENPFVVVQSNCANKGAAAASTQPTKGLLADENHFQ